MIMNTMTMITTNENDNIDNADSNKDDIRARQTDPQPVPTTFPDANITYEKS